MRSSHHCCRWTTCSQSSTSGLPRLAGSASPGIGREVEELVDDGRQLQGGEGVNFLRGPAQTGSPKEVRDVCGCSG